MVTSVIIKRSSQEIADDAELKEALVAKTDLAMSRTLGFFDALVKPKLTCGERASIIKFPEA